MSATEGSNKFQAWHPLYEMDVLRFEHSRDGDDESCTCSLASGLNVLSRVLSAMLKWLS